MAKFTRIGRENPSIKEKYLSPLDLGMERKRIFVLSPIYNYLK